MSCQNSYQSQWESFFKKYYWLFINGSPSKKKCKKELLELNIKKNGRILELGCGTGYFLRWFQKKGYENLYGLDYVTVLLEKLKEKGIHVINSSFEDYNAIPNEQFDLVFSDGVFEHYKDPEKILEKVSRLTKAYFITIVPRPTWWNKLQTLILRPPKEYHKNTEEWIAIHKGLGFQSVDFKILGLNCLMIICKK